jgi:hypothetical protein
MQGIGREGSVPLHARGLAICPLCCNEDPYRLRCRLCWGLGYVGRAMRNDYKLGRVRP